MVFSTHLFLFYFLPLVLLVYWSFPPLAARLGASEELVSRGRNIWLLVVSYVFYGWWNPWFILLMFGVTSANYVCGALMSRPHANDRQRFVAVTAAIVVSLGTLGFFKYFGLFQTTTNHLLVWFGAEPMRVLQILLPMGISFYVFHALSYSIDLYRREAPPARSLADFACYIALFPQLVAGPDHPLQHGRGPVPGSDAYRWRSSHRAWRCSFWASARRSCSPIPSAKSPTPHSTPNP